MFYVSLLFSSYPCQFKGPFRLPKSANMKGYFYYDVCRLYLNGSFKLLKTQWSLSLFPFPHKKSKVKVSHSFSVNQLFQVSVVNPTSHRVNYMQIELNASTHIPSV